MKEDDFDNCAVGDVFQDEYGGKWLKLSDTRCVRLISGEELESCRIMPDDKIH